MYQPVFPYLKNQAIITSGRVVVHSYDDFIFLFGKKGVSISSPTSFTVDANERTIVASPKIELGYNAEKDGDPLLLGSRTVQQLGILIDAIKELSDALNTMKAETLEASIPLITAKTTLLSSVATKVKSRLEQECLSNNTYTK